MSDRACMNCRYWSQMIARAGDGTDNAAGDTEALCLNASGSKSQKYTTATDACDGFGKNTVGAVDEPPDYGESARAAYAAQAEEKHPNGAPMWAPDGTLLDKHGNRSIFDDVDE